MAKEIKQQNAAQVLHGFMWNEKNQLPKKVLTGNLERGFQVDQTVLLEYLMKFQQWIFEQGAE